MTTFFPIPPSYELPVWPHPSNDIDDDPWSFINLECPLELPLLPDLELLNDAELCNHGNIENYLDSPMEPIPSHGGTVPEAILLPSTPPPETDALPSTATPGSIPLHIASHPAESTLLPCTPPPETHVWHGAPNPEQIVLNTTPAPAVSPLQSTPAHLQMIEPKLEASQVEIKDNLSGRVDRRVSNSTINVVPMDFENNELSSPKNIKEEEKQHDSATDSKTGMDNKTEVDQDFPADSEELPKTDLPARNCQSRYAFRPRGVSTNSRQSRPTVRKTTVLWKFIKELLDNNDTCVSWISREERSFKFVDSKQAAKLWGQKKNKRNMTYEKMSRAMRYYYDRQIMYHEEGQKLMYRFGDGAREDLPESEDDII